MNDVIFIFKIKNIKLKNIFFINILTENQFKEIIDVQKNKVEIQDKIIFDINFSNQNLILLLKLLFYKYAKDLDTEQDKCIHFKYDLCVKSELITIVNLINQLLTIQNSIHTEITCKEYEYNNLSIENKYNKNKPENIVLDKSTSSEGPSIHQRFDNLENLIIKENKILKEIIEKKNYQQKSSKILNIPDPTQINMDQYNDLRIKVFEYLNTKIKIVTEASDKNIFLTTKMIKDGFFAQLNNIVYNTKDCVYIITNCINEWVKKNNLATKTYHGAFTTKYIYKVEFIEN